MGDGVHLRRCSCSLDDEEQFRLRNVCEFSSSQVLVEYCLRTRAKSSIVGNESMVGSRYCT